MTHTTDTDRELYLIECGWNRAVHRWRHPNLFTPWPLRDAYRLQKEADSGQQDAVHRMIRTIARTTSKKNK